MSTSAPAASGPRASRTVALERAKSAVRGGRVRSRRSRCTRGSPLVGIVMVFPFVWMISTSFKQPADIYTLSLLPTQPTLDNYVTALTGFPFPRWFANSLLVAGVTTLSVAFFDSLAGYVLAKLEFPFKTSSLSPFCAR